MDRKVGREDTSHSGVSTGLKWKAEELAYFEVSTKVLSQENINMLTDSIFHTILSFTVVCLWCHVCSWKEPSFIFFFLSFSEWASSFYDLCSMKSFFLVMLLAVYLDCCHPPFYLAPVIEFFFARMLVLLSRIQ